MAARHRNVIVDSDDEDDEVPLAALAAKHKVAAAPSHRPVASSAPSSNPAKPKPIKMKKEKKASRSDPSQPRKSKIKAKSSPSSKPSKPASKAPAKRSRSASRPKSPSSSAGSKSKRYAEFTPGKAGNRELDKSWPLKHQAVEAILCRWPYSGLPYPPPGLDLAAPEGFMSLPGFPGVSVGVTTDNLGEVVDKRPKEPKPSMEYLLTLKSSTIARMYRASIQGQMQALVAVEGERVKTGRLYKSLVAELARTVVLIEKLAPKLDAQAAKHERASGRPELADRILAASGEKALADAGGLKLPGAQSPSSSSSAAAAAADTARPDVKPKIEAGAPPTSSSSSSSSSAAPIKSEPQ